MRYALHNHPTPPRKIETDPKIQHKIASPLENPSQKRHIPSKGQDSSLYFSMFYIDPTPGGIESMLRIPRAVEQRPCFYEAMQARHLPKPIDT